MEKEWVVVLASGIRNSELLTMIFEMTTAARKRSVGGRIPRRSRRCRLILKIQRLRSVLTTQLDEPEGIRRYLRNLRSFRLEHQLDAFGQTNRMGVVVVIRTFIPPLREASIITIHSEIPVDGSARSPLFDCGGWHVRMQTTTAAPQSAIQFTFRVRRIIAKQMLFRSLVPQNGSHYKILHSGERNYRNCGCQLTRSGQLHRLLSTEYCRFISSCASKSFFFLHPSILPSRCG